MDRLFEKVKNGWSRRKEITALNGYLNNPVWCLLQKVPSGYMQLKKTNLADHIEHKFKNRIKVKEELTKIYKIIRKIDKTKKIEIFDYKDIRPSGSVFDIEKLDFFNGHYIREMEIEKLVELCKPYLKGKGKRGTPTGTP